MSIAADPARIAASTFPAASLSAPSATNAATATPSSAASSDEGGFTFHDLLDIVNPLQHIPVVSTIYQHLTGDIPNTFTKIAGDTLYGGPTGFASSLADTVFQKITGKSFSETVLAKLEDIFDPSDSDSATPTAVASATPAVTSTAAAASDTPVAAPTTPVLVATAASPSFILSNAPVDTTATPVAAEAPALAAPASVTPASLDQIVVPGQDALLSALNRNGVTPDMAMRATDAYRRTVGVANAAANGAYANPALRATLVQ
jgi:hypothetical protein